MRSTSPHCLVPELLESAGVAVNGNNPWDIRVHHRLFYKRLVAGGAMDLGESYVDAWWDCDALDQFFDRIVSVGMLEHVGVGHYRTLIRVVRRCLAEAGLFLLQTIGGNHSVRSMDPWMARYIFPNSMLPSIRQIASAAEKLLVLEDWHSFGPHYDPTLLAWHHNFVTRWGRARPMMAAFSACGLTIYWPVPAPFAPARTSYGKSFFPETACGPVM